MKKIFNFFMALMVGATMITLSSCNKDEDKSTDAFSAAMEEMATLDPTVSEDGDNIVVVWAGKYYKATETFVFTNNMCTSVSCTGSVDCGNAATAQLVYAALQADVEDGYVYGVEGSKVTVSYTETEDFENMTKEAVLATLQMIYGD